MIKRFFFFLIIFTLITSSASYLLAQEETEQTEATEEQASESAELNTIKDQAAEEIREAVKEKVKQRLANLNGQRIGFVATLIDITETTLIVDSQGERYTLVTTDATVYQKAEEPEFDRQELALDSQLIVLGYYYLSNEEYEAAIVQEVEDLETSNRISKSLTINEVNRSSIEATDDQGTNWVLDVFSTTDITTQGADNDKEFIDLNELEEGEQIIVGGVLDEDDKSVNTINTHVVHRLNSNLPLDDDLGATEAGASGTPEN